MKLLSLFSGIGSFERALTNIGVDYELVGFSEIDKWAIESYAAIHDVSVDKNLGDVSEIAEEDLPNADLITYGFPCQDVSVAGLGAGIAEGTRSGLLYEAERIIEHVKPKYAIAENVKNLIGKRHREDFDKLLERLEGYGYNNYWEVLNAKEFGIPQNRERVFIVSIRKDVDDGTFEFPQGVDSGVRLKDMLLEGEVEDKYYIENEKASRLLSRFSEKELEQQSLLGGEQKNQAIKSDGISTTLTSSMGMGGGYVPMKVEPNENIGVSVSKQGKEIGKELEYSHTLLARDYKGFGNQAMTGVLEPNELKLHKNLSGGKWDRIHESARRVYEESGVAPTIPTVGGGNIEPKVYTDYRIRKLTPQECWRLMGFEDEDYWTARRRLEEKFYNGGDRSNSQMYKQAGNSIVVDVLEGLFENLIKGD